MSARTKAVHVPAGGFLRSTACAGHHPLLDWDPWLGWVDVKCGRRLAVQPPKPAGARYRHVDDPQEVEGLAILMAAIDRELEGTA